MQTNPQDILKTLSLSFEVFPPKKWEDFPGLYETLDELKGLHPEFISCTYGAGGSNSKKTAEIASHIENELGIRSIAHLTCAALTEDKLLSTIENFKNAGIHSVLALRGDKPFDMSEEDFANRQYKHPSEIIPILKKAGFRVAAACYPEKHYEKLRQAWQRMQSIRNYAESGGRVLAECGGMIYLSKGILLDRSEHSDSEVGLQAGVLPFFISNRKADRRLTLGYRQFDYNGQHLRGHEFHYTQFEPKPEESLESVTQVYNAKRMPVSTPVFRYKNVIASYTHLYWGEIDLLKLFER